MGTSRAIPLIYFSLISYTSHLFNFYCCIENFHQRGFTVSFNSHSSVTAETFWPFSKQSWSSHLPLPPEPHWTAASAYFWFGRKSLTCWVTSSTSCDVLGKTTVDLARILSTSLTVVSELHRMENFESCSVSYTKAFAPTLFSLGGFLS